MNSKEWIVLGKKHQKIRDLTIKWIKLKHQNHISYCELHQQIEHNIKNTHTKLAFPIGISVNHIAAHDTAFPNDTRSFNPCTDFVKIDFGIHEKGYIIDSAFTWNPKFIGLEITQIEENCIDATKETVKKMISLCRPDMLVYDLAKEAEEIIQSYDNVYSIPELTGHTIERWKIHGNKLLPSSTKITEYFKSNPRIQCGDVCAIEVFVTNSKYPVKMMDIQASNHFTMKHPEKGIPNYLSPLSKQFFSQIQRKHSLRLPFSQKMYSQGGHNEWARVVSECYQKGVISIYPPVYVEKDKIVAQTEDTILVKPQKTIQLTNMSDLTI